MINPLLPYDLDWFLIVNFSTLINTLYSSLLDIINPPYIFHTAELHIFKFIIEIFPGFPAIAFIFVVIVMTGATITNVVITNIIVSFDFCDTYYLIPIFKGCAFCFGCCPFSTCFIVNPIRSIPSIMLVFQCSLQPFAIFFFIYCNTYFVIFFIYYYHIYHFHFIYKI